MQFRVNVSAQWQLHTASAAVVAMQQVMATIMVAVHCW